MVAALGGSEPSDRNTFGMWEEERSAFADRNTFGMWEEERRAFARSTGS